LPNARLEMVLLFFFGWTFGMTSFSMRSFQDYSHLQRMKRSLWLTFSQQQICLHTHLPLSEQVYEEYHELQEIVQSIQIRPEHKDQWKYIWGSRKYTANSYYKYLHKEMQPPKPFTKSRVKTQKVLDPTMLCKSRHNTTLPRCGFTGTLRCLYEDPPMSNNPIGFRTKRSTKLPNGSIPHHKITNPTPP
jgi:hypothetical protein